METKPGEGPVALLLAFPLEESGGIAAFVRSLAPALDRCLGGALRVVTPAPDGAWTGRADQLRFARETLGRLRAMRPRAIHTHESLILLAVAMLHKAMRMGRVGVVHTVHVDPAVARAWWKRVLVGLLFARCDRVVVVARDAIRRLDNLAFDLGREVQVIYGAPPAVPRPAVEEIASARAAFGLGPGPVLCQLTRFYYPLKVAGAARLIRAFAQVRAAVPDAQLLLGGDGPLWEEFRTTHGLVTPRDGIVMPGYVHDVGKVMGVADIVCHITSQDMLPIVIFEAMDLGKAVVASAVGGIPEVIDHGVNGLLVDADEDALAVHLIDLLRHPDRVAALGRNAAATMAARFTWAASAAEYARLDRPLRRRALGPRCNASSPGDQARRGRNMAGETSVDVESV